MRIKKGIYKERPGNEEKKKRLKLEMRKKLLERFAESDRRQAEAKAFILENRKKRIAG